MGKSNAKRAARRSHLAGMAENIATSTGSYHCYRLLRVQIENAPAITREDIDLAVQKILDKDKDIDNYIFITTSEIPQEVNNYAKSLYEKTGGVEIAVLDCISFLPHFIHLFHRSRTRYVEEYQQLVLNEPDSAVSQPLKELWLSLRSAAESGLGNGE